MNLSQVVNRLADLFPSLVDGAGRVFARPGGSERERITAVIIHCGESTYDACLAAVDAQTVPVTVKTVRDVSPLSASLDAAVDACETRWLLMVDADTILHPHCVAALRRKLRPGVGMVAAMLQDKVYGRIGFLRVLDASVLRKQGFRHPVDDPQPDRRARDCILAQGLHRVELRSVLGVHNPYATPFETFRRFYGTYRKRTAERHSSTSHVRAIMSYAVREKRWDEAYVMMAGLMCAAQVDSEQPRDYVDDGELRSHFEAVSTLLERKPAG